LFDIDRTCTDYTVRDTIDFSTREQLIQSFNVMALANQLFHVNIYSNPYLANQFLQLADVDGEMKSLLHNRRPRHLKAAPLPLDQLQDIFFIKDYEFIAFGKADHDTDIEHVLSELYNLVSKDENKVPPTKQGHANAEAMR
jgi:hypothetical protein